MHRKPEIQEDLKPELSKYDRKYFQCIHKNPVFHNNVAQIAQPNNGMPYVSKPMPLLSCLHFSG